MANVSVNLHPGYIRVPLAYHNHYLVSTDAGELTAIALESGSGRRGGHIGSGAYMPGAVVLVAVMATQEEWSRNVNLPNLIIGAFDPFPSVSKTATDAQGTDFDITEQVPNSFSDVNNNYANKLLVEQDAEQLLNEDRSKNRAMDVLPGEWFKSTVLGGIFLLSDFMARAGVSPHCNMTFHGLNDTLETRCKNFTRDMESRLQQIVQRGFGSLEVDSYALNVQEGLGVGTASGFLVSAEDDNNPAKLKPAVIQQSGFFRRMLMRGGDADGSWEVIKMDPAPPDYYTTAPREYQGLLSEMRRFDGIYRLQAAKEIKLEKTGMITVPQQIGDLINTPTPTDGAPADSGLIDDEEIQQEFELTTEQQATLRPLLHKEFASYEEQNMFFKTLRNEAGVWVFEAPPVQTTTYNTLPADQQEYSVSDLSNLLTDVVEVYPGRRVKLFKNSSVFLMSEDGGIVIGDGFGAEIRMNRGKITIASAGDIDILPGRDVRTLAPRSIIQKARDHIHISATRGSVGIKAQENMQLLSGNGGSGITTIENRSSDTNLAEIQDRQLTDGSAIGSGILLKSHNSGISCLGDHMYVGPYSPTGESTAGVLNSSRTCNIFMDSGSGATMLTGAEGIFTYRDAAMLAMQGTATGMYMDSDNIINVAGNSLVMASPSVAIDKATGHVLKPTLTASGIQTRSQRMPSAEPNLVIQGAAQVKGTLYVKGSMASEGAVSANDGFNGNFPLFGKDRFTEKLSASVGTEIAALVEALTGRAGFVMSAMVAKGIATQRGHLATNFSYPDSDSPVFNAKDFSLVVPRWQQLLQTQTTWVENPVHSAIFDRDTYPYPGREQYSADSAVLIQPGSDNKGVSASKMDSYPVNA